MKHLALVVLVFLLALSAAAQSKKQAKKEKARAEKAAKKELRSAKKGDENARLNIEEKLYQNKEALEKEEKEMFQRAGLDEIEGRMVQALNTEFISKARQLRQDESLSQQQRQGELQMLTRQRHERILGLLGSSKKASLDREESSWRASRGLGDWSNGYGNETPDWK